MHSIIYSLPATRDQLGCAKDPHQAFHSTLEKQFRANPTNITREQADRESTQAYASTLISLIKNLHLQHSFWLHTKESYDKRELLSVSVFIYTDWLSNF